MNKILKENDIGFNLSSNKEEFIFDNERMCNSTPYMVFKDGDIVDAIFIEKLEYNTDFIFIKGWSIGAQLLINNSGSNKYLLKRSNREDVSNELGVDSIDAGFTLQINIYDNKSIFIEFNELKIELKINSALNKDLALEKQERHYDFELKNHRLLIVGGAPTIKLHLEKIKNFEGEIWALNDAVFWLEKNNIPVDKLIVADQRFINKQIEKLPELNCNTIVSADYINFEPIAPSLFNHFRIKVLGRDGLSEKLGEAFHGCTVANLALQTARLSNYKSITTVGVLLHFPTAYERVDGTKTMPEYVHKNQIKNMKKTIQKIRQERISLTALELNSNINFF